jgi:hypothetical protein
VVGQLASWNAFALAALLALAALVRHPQGAALLDRLRGRIADSADPAWPFALVVTGLGLCLALAALLVARLGQRRLDELIETHRLPRWPVQLLADGVVPVLLALAPWWIVGSRLDLAAFHEAAGVLAALVVSALVAWLLGRHGWLGRFVRPPGAALTVALPALALLALVALGVWFTASPHNARNLGALFVVIVALALWATLLCTALTLLPVALGLPNLALLAPVAWLAFAALDRPHPFPAADGAPAAGTVAPAAPVPTRPTVEQAFGAWLARLPEADAAGPLNVVLVAAEGGVSRAAPFTALALSRLHRESGGRLAPHVFAYSAVGGGSIGVTAFALAQSGADGADHTARLADFAQRDALSPALARLLVVDPARRLLGRWLPIEPRDRALERRLADDWNDVLGDPRFGAPFLAALPAAPAGAAPAMFLNATHVESGRRVVVSNVAPIGDDRVLDLFAFGDPSTIQRVSVAEAAFLGARVPPIAPPAIVPGRDGSLRPPGAARLLDGGHDDNSGAATLRSVLLRLQSMRAAAAAGEPGSAGDPAAARRLARVTFQVIALRNDEGEPADGAIPARFAGAIGSTRDAERAARRARAETARAELARAVAAGRVDRYHEVTLADGLTRWRAAAPGARVDGCGAPPARPAGPLGWMLSVDGAHVVRCAVAHAAIPPFDPPAR